jgi:arsenate reductase
MKANVLFVCVHNSARSQMAEAFLNRAAPDLFAVYSAGLEPGTLNADVVKAMGEIGYDISRARVKAVSAPEIASKTFRYVVTVCAESEAGACPIVPTEGRSEHWFFGDPSKVTGDDHVRMQMIREIRDRIRLRVESWAAARRAELASVDV